MLYPGIRHELAFVVECSVFSLGECSVFSLEDLGFRVLGLGECSVFSLGECSV